MFACDLGLNGKTLPCNFFGCFVFRFQEIMHAKNAGFPEPAMAANVHFADSIV